MSDFEDIIDINIPDKVSNSLNNDSIGFLYWTLIAIVSIILLWIIIMVFAKSDPVLILSEMTKRSSIVEPVSDIV